ncbi:MAG: class I SAM-dependent rRNA methyltransferase [Terrimicrobiaceae bacterium]
MAGIVVRPRARILHGHDWVYATEVLKTFGSPATGDVISIKDGRDRLLGSAIYNPSSQIVARRISRRRQGLDAEFFVRRIAHAVAWREAAGRDLELCRLIWSEADGLPGVIADRYADVVVLQTLTFAMDLHKEMIAAELLRLPGVKTIVERNDSAIRQAEGLPEVAGLLAGREPGKRIVSMGGVRFEVDFLGGQKTGLYLDQADNARAVAAQAEGRTVLDAFSNQGGFALACAREGARSVTAIESGADSVARLRRNASLNDSELEVFQENVFDCLPALEKAGRKFDLIVLDPPSFTRAKGKINDALRGYRELHRLVAPLLENGGLIATFCCSHHVSESEFTSAVADGLYEGRRSVNILARMGQATDHPVALHLPETRYLKGLLLAARPSF